MEFDQQKWEFPPLRAKAVKRPWGRLGEKRLEALLRFLLDSENATQRCAKATSYILEDWQDGKSLQYIFGSTETHYGLDVKKRGKDYYAITMGCYFETCGDGCTWHVQYKEDHVISATCGGMLII